MFHSDALKFTYQDGTMLQFPALQLKQKDSLLILGPSGSGKSTWLQLLAGILRPQEGDIRFMDTPFRDLRSAAMDRFRARHIAMVFQEHRFIPSLSAEENLRISLNGIPLDKAHLNTLAERLNLAPLLSKKPGRLSVGEQQRLSLLRAFLKKPALVLADEPSSSLDDDNAESMIRLLRSQSEETGAILVVVTHDQRLREKFERRILL